MAEHHSSRTIPSNPPLISMYSTEPIRWIVIRKNPDECLIHPDFLIYVMKSAYYFVTISLNVEKISLMSFQKVARSTYSRSMASLSGITVSI